VTTTEAKGSDMETDRRYAVVVNLDGYYSIWPLGRDLPMGWRTEGTTGTEEACVAYIDQVWTGLEPGSLRAARTGPV
jgi:MbtH protein